MSYEHPRTISNIDLVLLSTLLNRKLNVVGVFNADIAYIPLKKEWIVGVRKIPASTITVDPNSIGKHAEMQALADQLAARLINIFTGAANESL